MEDEELTQVVKQIVAEDIHVLTHLQPFAEIEVEITAVANCPFR